MAYDLSDQLQAGVVYTYDENFESRVSAELKVRFGSGAKPKSTPVVIAALNATPSNRNVRTANSAIHNCSDPSNWEEICHFTNMGSTTIDFDDFHGGGGSDWDDQILDLDFSLN